MNILSIAGSDPSSGAGIQSDIKTISAYGAYGLTVITSITSQNTSKFFGTAALPSKSISEQLNSVFSDFKIDAIKIGMVYNSPIIKIVSSKLKKLKVPIIVDPIIKSTTGGILLQKNALPDYKRLIVPLAFIITPNVCEAEILSGLKIRKPDDLLMCAKKIKKLGAKNIVITGVEFEENKISDFILSDSKHYFLSTKKIKKENHGSGCTYSAALTVAIANKKNIIEAAGIAKKYSLISIKNSRKIGKGIVITQIPAKKENDKKILNDSIIKFTKLKNINRYIPECQTNFVYSKKSPRTVKDVLGVSGRIVKAGKKIVVAGEIEYGGSKHVGSAIIHVCKKFPQIRSALNIKFEPKIVKKFIKNGFVVLSYDRNLEPFKIKNKENLSIPWGIKSAIQHSNVSPDVIFHKGDFGKEPMILLFGKNPNDVLKKLNCVL